MAVAGASRSSAAICAGVFFFRLLSFFFFKQRLLSQVCGRAFQYLVAQGLPVCGSMGWSRRFFAVVGAHAQWLDRGCRDFFRQLASRHGGAGVGRVGLGVGGFFDVHFDHLQPL